MKIEDLHFKRVVNKFLELRLTTPVPMPLYLDKCLSTAPLT